jgi:nicotinate-nucleotide--dimethylbenzimidazole phosphoribosyltransferase
MNLIEQTLAAVRPVDRDKAPALREHLDSLTKPRGSLGRLEDLAVQYALAANTLHPRVAGKRIYTFAADHGVAAEGVSAFPQTVTAQMVRNMLAGGAAVNVLARHVGAEVLVVDVGVADPLCDAPGLIRRKVRPGTGNIARGPAMSAEEAARAVEVGIELANAAKADNISLLGAGEMGIANTTAASAVMAALLPCEPAEVTGKGTGVDDAALARKVQVIAKALQVNSARLGEPLGALAAVGGLEIAAICGLILGAAACRLPVVVDGFICCAGALVACKARPEVKEYLFFSHRSTEPGHTAFLRWAGAEPILDLGMRLGEGTGAALAMGVIEAAVKVYGEMATFDSAGVSRKDG